MPMKLPALENRGIRKTATLRITANLPAQQEDDLLAVEEPLEIRLSFGPKGQRETRSLAVTMRTPGQDKPLALGFLFTEGLIGKAEEVLEIRHINRVTVPETPDNILLVELAERVAIDFGRLNRHFYTSSSCGV